MEACAGCADRGEKPVSAARCTYVQYQKVTMNCKSMLLTYQAFPWSSIAQCLPPMFPSRVPSHATLPEHTCCLPHLLEHIEKHHNADTPLQRPSNMRDGLPSPNRTYPPPKPTRHPSLPPHTSPISPAQPPTPEIPRSRALQLLYSNCKNSVFRQQTSTGRPSRPKWAPVSTEDGR